MRCLAVKIPPSMIHTPATTMYEIPRKGFWPPITVVVDNTRLFVPPYSVTGKSQISPLQTINEQKKGWVLETYS